MLVERDLQETESQDNILGTQKVKKDISLGPRICLVMDPVPVTQGK